MVGHCVSKMLISRGIYGWKLYPNTSNESLIVSSSVDIITHVKIVYITGIGELLLIFQLALYYTLHVPFLKCMPIRP